MMWTVNDFGWMENSIVLPFYSKLQNRMLNWWIISFSHCIARCLTSGKLNGKFFSSRARLLHQQIKAVCASRLAPRMENFHSVASTLHRKSIRSVISLLFFSFKALEMGNINKTVDTLFQHSLNKEVPIQLPRRKTTQVSPHVNDPGRLCWQQDMSRVHFVIVEFRPKTAQRNQSFLGLWYCRLSKRHQPTGSDRLESHLRRQQRRRWFQHRAGRSPMWRFVYTTSQCLICIRR